MMDDSGDSSAAGRIQQKMRRLLLQLRQPQWDRGHHVNLSKPVVYYEEAHFRDRPYNVPLFILRTTPCSWLSAGGCSMCNYHLVSAMAEAVSREQLASQIDFVVAQVQGRELPYILVTSAGSFLDDREIPEDMRLELLRRLAKAGLGALSFECRASFLTDRARLRRCAEAFEGGTLQVGIGLESADAFIRNVIVHKGLSEATIDSALGALSAEHIAYYFYVMLGKPFMSLAEDLADTVATISRAFDLGASMVVLETMNIQPYTLTKLLYSQGLYEPPSLWLAIEALQRLPMRLRRRVAIKGYEKAEPMPEALPSTCARCCDTVRLCLRRWNLERKWSVLNEARERCDCHEAFLCRLALALPKEPLMSRVEDSLDHLLNLAPATR